MPYSAQHKEETRDRILTSAFKLFSSRGYDNVSINEIMADASLTRGGFYSHFENKSKLYHEAILYSAKNSKIAQGKPNELDNKAWMEELLNSYLHRDNIVNNPHCPLAALVTDVTVREPEVRKAYTKTFKGMANRIGSYVKSYSNCSDETILATTAMIVGGLAIARAVSDVKLSNQILDNCRDEALRLLNISGSKKE